MILAALMVPGIQNVRARAKSAKCLNHLRQIGAGFLLYAGENNQSLPLFINYNTNSWWSDEINPYLGVENGWGTFNALYLCPAARWQDQPGAFTWNMSYCYGFCLTASGLKLPSISKPGKFFLVGDAVQVASWHSAASYLRYPENKNATPESYDTDMATDNEWGWIRYRHDKRANFVFADGHVEAVDRQAAGNPDWLQHWEN